MQDFVKYVLKDREMKKRLLVTILTIFIYKVIILIPAPGINIFAVISFFKQFTTKQEWGLATPMARVSVFALGVMPYILACFLLQIISAVCKPIRRLFFSGETGRRKIGRY